MLQETKTFDSLASLNQTEKKKHWWIIISILFLLLVRLTYFITYSIIYSHKLFTSDDNYDTILSLTLSAIYVYLILAIYDALFRNNFYDLAIYLIITIIHGSLSCYMFMKVKQP